MAMPATGSIAIISAPQTCGSICASVAQSTGSLLALGADACKTLPISMASFHSYVGPATYHAIGFCLMSQTGTNGVSNSVTNCNCVCSNVAAIAGQCYNITLNHCLCSTNCTGGRAIVCLCCNSATLYGCTVLAGSTGAGFSCTFNVHGGDTICIYALALHGAPGVGTPASCVRSCITSISNASPAYGLFCKGAASCTDCTINALL